MKKKIVLIVVMLTMILGVNVYAQSYTGDMDVNILATETYKVRTVGGTIPLSVRLNATTESRGNKYVQYRVLTFYNETPLCDWIRVLEGGSIKYGSFLDDCGFDRCYAGDEIYVVWKNSTNFYWANYTVNGTFNYY